MLIILCICSDNGNIFYRKTASEFNFSFEKYQNASETIADTLSNSVLQHFAPRFNAGNYKEEQNIHKSNNANGFQCSSVITREFLQTTTMTPPSQMLQMSQ